ncbi:MULTISPECIES: hypothetical protein [Moorena]|uniref:hypothetical protein n=1 Tax=Moorena TaxID=1155738 RepID=UPI0010542F76|nr:MULTISPECIES: hypothetical protein [Moorena]NEQ06040.1 hypothetical protein [Moorena sp. SIO4E2]NET66371.1 hypothetical protein [Moorena sp. SIO1G6]
MVLLEVRSAVSAQWSAVSAQWSALFQCVPVLFKSTSSSALAESSQLNAYVGGVLLVVAFRFIPSYCSILI